MPSITVTTEQLTELSNHLSALQNAIAALIEQPEPEVPAPEPIPEPEPVEPKPEQVTAIVTVTNNTGGEWVNGVSKQTTRILIASTPESKRAAVVGATATFADGSKRKVTEVASDAKNLYPKFEGDKLDPAVVGHPNNVTFTAGSDNGSAVEPVPKPEEGEVAAPEVEPVPPVSGVKRKGIVGTNLGMGQGASGKIPGIQGTDFNFPIESEIVRAKGYKLTRFRVGGLFERFFKTLGSTEMYLGKDAKGKEYSSTSVIRVGQLCKKHGCTVKWNPFHNYGTVFGKKVGSSGGLTAAQFGQAWRAFILHVKSDPDAWAATYGFDLMNEWSGMEFQPIFDATQAVLDVCADILEDKMIVPEGKDYSSTANWVRNNDGFKNLKDPRGPGFIEFSGHLYLDQDASGFYKSGDTARAPHTPESVGVDRLKGFADWIDQHGFRGNIGETIVPGDMPRLLKGLENMLVMARDRGIDVYIFGLGDWFGDDYTTVHNLEIARNRPTLELVQKFTKGLI